ncbi:helix-turn-helix domain-containing protein [Myxococcus sp. CA040A]|uniref:AraC family transcriptional regulator n=1 Tax=Myxococcus sp. CA040A TaxID=2741738 RepID=UPI00157B24CB|nr:helix-turn-helix domain-containing protein [Myxococcus sp. CA040A]NTX04250.1 AraC family transcriptional regulator [Myxococcus sp. CA040A]
MTQVHSFYRALAPPEPLRPFIQAFWLYDGYRPGHGLERVLPTGTLELVIPLAGQRLEWRELDGEAGACAEALVSGPRRAAFDVPTAQQSMLAGVHFRAGGAWPLLGVPLDALAGRHVELSSLWGPVATRWVARLSEASSDEERFAILGTAFLARQSSLRTVHEAVWTALGRLRASTADVPVSSLVAGSGLSHRRFIELFRREVGLTPRDFLRVRRFQQALQRTREDATASLTWLAHEAGYCDQSHWLLECRKLSGLAPGALSAAARGATALPPEERGQMLPIG